MKQKLDGKAYQELVAEIQKAFDPSATIKVSEWINGPDGRRDMDVSIRGTIDGVEKLAFIECKDYDPKRKGSRVGISVVDALESKRKDLNADYTFICSNSGFTKEALNKAKRTGIGMISALKEGDGRVKIVIEETHYFRKVKANPKLVTFHSPNKLALSEKKPIITFNGRPVDAWLASKAAIAAANNSQLKGCVKAIFRFKQPTEFQTSENKKITLNAIEIEFEPEQQWYSQIVEIDAKLGFYDYLRRKIQLVGGDNKYFIKGLNFDEGTPLDQAPTSEQPGAGEIGLSIQIIEEVPDQNSIPDLDPLILPEDLSSLFY